MDDIVRLLNLPAEVVDNLVAELLFDRYVLVDSESGRTTLALSGTGKTLVGTLKEERVIEDSLTYIVDGLTGEPIQVSRQLLLSADNLDESPRLVLSGETEPDLDFGPDDTPLFLAVPPVKNENERTLLTVLGVESTTKQYIKAVLLLFESETDSNDRYLRVCVDGRQDERVEALVRENGLLESMRLAERIHEDQRRVDRILSEPVLAQRVGDAEVENALEELWQLSPVSSGNADETALDARRAKVRARLAAMPARKLSVGEATEASEIAMLSARDGVLISASRIWPSARREHYMDLLRQLLAAGCPVTFETVPLQQMSKVDRLERSELTREFSEGGIEFSPTKPANEASFVVIDQASMFVYPGTPFGEVATLFDRLGDDRPTVIRGWDLVQAVLKNAHGENGRFRGRTAELARSSRRQVAQ